MARRSLTKKLNKKKIYRKEAQQKLKSMALDGKTACSTHVHADTNLQNMEGLQSEA
jgi:hypothetical protein